MVDDFFQRLGRFVREIVRHHFRRGRQANEVIVDAADKRASVGVGHRPQALGLKAGEHVAVNAGARPSLVFDGGRFVLYGLKGPELFAGLNIDLAVDGCGALGRAGIGRAHHHPALEIRNDLGGKLFLGRHLQVIIVPAYRFDEQALLEVAGNDGRPSITALARGSFGVE